MTFKIDHDMHCHSILSKCSQDPGQTVSAILANAKKHGFNLQCITDHVWDRDVPGASGWYASQDIDHICRNLPLPEDDQVRMVFGCETEFCGGKKLGLAPRHFDLFDFIIIPPNHFHMINFVRPSSYDNEEKLADLLVGRLEEIALLDLPWHKIGIAHMNGFILPGGDTDLLIRSVDEKRFRAVMNKFARLGAGIELNMGADCFPAGWQKRADDKLRLYRIAKEEGCKFYLGSDGHHPNDFDEITDVAPDVIAALGLTENDRFRINT